MVVWGLAPTKMFLGPHSLKRQKMSLFKTEYSLFLLLNLYGKVCLKLASLNFLDLKLKRRQLRQPLFFPIKYLYADTKKKAISRRIHLWSTQNAMKTLPLRYKTFKAESVVVLYTIQNDNIQTPAVARV